METVSRHFLSFINIYRNYCCSNGNLMRTQIIVSECASIADIKYLLFAYRRPHQKTLVGGIDICLWKCRIIGNWAPLKRHSCDSVARSGNVARPCDWIRVLVVFARQRLIVCNNTIALFSSRSILMVFAVIIVAFYAVHIVEVYLLHSVPSAKTLPLHLRGVVMLYKMMLSSSGSCDAEKHILWHRFLGTVVNRLGNAYA